MALLLALVVTASVSGCESWRGDDLELMIRAPAYPRPRCAKGDKSLGPVSPLGEPISGATVVLKPSGLRGISDSAGRVKIADVPRGTHTLVVSAPGFRPLQPREIRTPSTTIQTRLMPCITAGAHRLRVGFGKKIALRANNVCGPEWEGATYRWRQLEGPDVAESVKTWSSPALVFTTATIERARGALPREPQVLSFSPEQAGEHVFALEADNNKGQRSLAHVLVSATSVASGLTSVAPHHRYYVLGHATGPWDWRLVKPPKGWRITLDGAKTRTPSVLPVPPAPLDLQHTVMLQERHSGLTFSLVFGHWNVVRRDCGRPECHAAMESHWKATRHARSWQRLLDGKLTLERGPAAERCATCHSLGYDRTTANGGYDDVADEMKISFPDKLTEGNYEALPEPVKEVSNVYCLACHGPARVDPPIAEAPGMFHVGVCARCHDRPPEQDLVAQWRSTKHASTVTDGLNGPAQRQECARCHSAQGYYYAKATLSRPPNARTAVLTCCETAAPISCQACHNPMLAANKGLHVHGTVITESGLRLERVGAAAQCASCHNAWKDHERPEVLDARQAPHAPQADLSYGRAGYALDAPAAYPKLEGIACAEETPQGCVSCHMHEADGSAELGGHTFRMASPPPGNQARATSTSTSPGAATGTSRDKPNEQDRSSGQRGKQNVAACRGCHEKMASFNAPAKGDYDGDGKVEGNIDEVEGLMDLLKRRIEAAIATRGYRGCDAKKSPGRSYAVGYRQKIVIVDEAGQDLGDCDDSGAIERAERPFTFPEADVALHKAAYNHELLRADRSRGLHNYPFAIKLLQRTIYAVSGGEKLPDWTIRPR